MQTKACIFFSLSTVDTVDLNFALSPFTYDLSIKESYLSSS